MRSLLYVPVIHEAADLGTVSSVAHERARDFVGRGAWENHRRTVNGFWEQIAVFFRNIEASGLEIFQEGVPVEGEIAGRILQDGADKGSANFRIVNDLINRGGVLKKTEDLNLLRKELIRIRKFAENFPKAEKRNGDLREQASDDLLMTHRDRFTAECINHTLERRGVLFMGALHNVNSYLDKDIKIMELKEKIKVQAYLKMLYGKGPLDLLKTLSRYMVSPVQVKQNR